MKAEAWNREMEWRERREATKQRHHEELMEIEYKKLEVMRQYLEVISPHVAQENV